MKLFKLSASALATATALTMAQSAFCSRSGKFRVFWLNQKALWCHPTSIEGDKKFYWLMH